MRCTAATQDCLPSRAGFSDSRVQMHVPWPTSAAEHKKTCQRNQRIPLAPDGEHVLAVAAVCAKAHILRRGLLIADANAADRTTFDFTAFEVELQVAEHAILRGRILGHQKLSHARANFGIQCQ